MHVREHSEGGTMSRMMRDILLKTRNDHARKVIQDVSVENAARLFDESSDWNNIVDLVAMPHCVCFCDYEWLQENLTFPFSDEDMEILADSTIAVMNAPDGSSDAEFPNIVRLENTSFACINKLYRQARHRCGRNQALGACYESYLLRLDCYAKEWREDIPTDISKWNIAPMISIPIEYMFQRPRVLIYADSVPLSPQIEQDDTEGLRSTELADRFTLSSVVYGMSLQYWEEWQRQNREREPSLQRFSYTLNKAIAGENSLAILWNRIDKTGLLSKTGPNKGKPILADVALSPPAAVRIVR